MLIDTKQCAIDIVRKPFSFENSILVIFIMELLFGFGRVADADVGSEVNLLAFGESFGIKNKTMPKHNASQNTLIQHDIVIPESPILTKYPPRYTPIIQPKVDAVELIATADALCSDVLHSSITNPFARPILNRVPPLKFFF